MKERQSGMDTLIDATPDWKRHWDASGMPAHEHQSEKSWQTIVMHFPTLHDREQFLALTGHPDASAQKPYIHFPRQDHKRWTTEKARHVPPNRYPVYVISKSRWDHALRLTSRNLEKLGIKHYLVVEEQEEQEYLAVIDRRFTTLLLLSEQAGQGCSIPARNFAWEHSILLGAKRHWVVDDNIDGWYWLRTGESGPEKPKVTDFNPFSPIEKFVDQFENVGIAGMQYESFCPRRIPRDPYVLNTRVYSCILVRNDLRERDGSPMRWRGRYNEDTDLCLRVLKTRTLCTVLFNKYQAKKMPTMKFAGGNTDKLYRQTKEFDGRLKMAESLKRQHPEISKITYKWGRFQHQVDYSGFRQRLARLPKIRP